MNSTQTGEDMNIVEKAKMYALYAHENQIYDSCIPYIAHLEATKNIIVQYGYDDVNMQAAALLHDTVEDAPLRINLPLISVDFNDEVAMLVGLLTNKQGANRKQKQENTYPLIAKNEKASAIKLADRICHYRIGITFGNIKKMQMYMLEYQSFIGMIYNDEFEKLRPMWKELDKLDITAKEMFARRK